MTEVERFEKQVSRAQSERDRAKSALAEATERFENAAMQLALACDRLERAKERAEKHIVGCDCDHCTGEYP